MNSRKDCYLTIIGMILVVFIFGGSCAVMSLQFIYHEDINFHVRVISWIIFAFSVCTFLASIVGLFNLRTLEKYLV